MKRGVAKPDSETGAIGDAVGAVFRWRRNVTGLFAMVLGAMILAPCFGFFATLLRASEPVEATVVERWYALEPRYDAPPSGDWPPLSHFDVTSSAVVEYVANGQAHRTWLRNPRKEAALYGDLDEHVPVTQLELRLPRGELARFPQADALRDIVHSPASYIHHAWTSAATPPRLVFDTAHPERTILLRGSLMAVAGAALPAAALGFMLMLAGFVRMEARSRTARALRLALWSLPLFAAPAVAMLTARVDADSSSMLRGLRAVAQAPQASLRLFGHVVGEPVAPAPYDSIRFDEARSPYRALWSTLSLRRPPDCCEDGVVAAREAAAQIRMQPGAVEAIEQLSAAGHRGFDALLAPEP